MKSRIIFARIVSLLLVMMCMLPIFSVSAADSEATLEIVNGDGSTEKYDGSFTELRTKVNTFMKKEHTGTAVCTLTLNKDIVQTDTGNFSGTCTSHGQAFFIFNLNGYDLKVDNTNASSNYIYYPYAGGVTVNGEGKDGDISKLISRSKAGFIYNNANSTDAIIEIKNLETEFSNMSLGYSDTNAYPHQPIYNFTAGTVIMDNVKTTFTGTDTYAVEGSTGGTDLTTLQIPFIQANRSATITVNNCEFNDINTKGIVTYGVRAASSSSPVDLTNTKIHATYPLYQTVAAQKISFTGCELSAVKAIFSGAGAPTVTDCVIHAEDCSLTASGIKPSFLYGSGKTVVYAPSIAAGTYTLEEGYFFVKQADGCFAISDGNGYPTVSFSAIYQSGMVFQREEPIVISGSCNTDGNTVEVILASVTKTATVVNGQWSVEFEPMAAATGLTLSIKEVEPEYSVATVFDDIAIGDVFILSGQSNMDYQAKYLEDYEEFLANADNFSNLRGFLVPNSYRHGEDKIGNGSWVELNSENIGNFSAIGYVMATKIAAEMSDVTIAIVDATYPGSIAKTWIDIDTYIQYFGESHTDVKNYRAYLDFYNKNGRCPTSASELSAWVGKSYQQIVAACYDSMIAFLDGYSAKATVWYQGEGDLGRVSTYTTYYQALTDSFRKTFNNEDMDFIVIQLAPYSSGNSINNFRAMQATLPNIDAHTYIVPTSNEGAVFNSPEFTNNSDISLVFVHTSVKSPIGLNAADVVLNKIYNIDGANRHLEIESISREGSTVVITFNQNVVTGGVDEVLGFELAGSNGTFVKADAVIDGNTVTLSASGIDTPTNVRYGYGSFYIEYQDGRIVVPVTGYSGGTLTTTTLTFKDTEGNTHVITRDAGEVLRSAIPGNVTSETGAPLGVFSLGID